MQSSTKKESRDASVCRVIVKPQVVDFFDYGRHPHKFQPLILPEKDSVNMHSYDPFTVSISSFCIKKNW